MPIDSNLSSAERKASYRRCGCPYLSGDTWCYDPDARNGHGRVGKAAQKVYTQGQELLKQPENQLRNLKDTYARVLEDNKGIWSLADMRDYLLKTKQIPFRNYGCPRASLTCCGSCSRKCDCRCPQDVLQRAYMKIAHLLYAHENYDADTFQQYYSNAPLGIRYLFAEWNSKEPSYFRIQAQVAELIDPRKNKELRRIIEEEYHNEDTPEKLDYAPTAEYEYDQKTDTTKKKVDPKTGVVSYLEWPLSGMCPFCLPMGLTDNRRKSGYKRGPYNKSNPE